jgi:hypothetical protein
MRFEVACPADDTALRRLLRETPMEGDIQITFEREPCIDFANGIEGDRTDILLGRPGPQQDPVAMGARTLLKSFVNGVPTHVGYLGQLRIQPNFRGRAGVLRRGYAALRELARNSDDVTLFVTTIVADNLAARRVFEAGLPGLPRYRHLGDVLSLIFPTGVRRRADAARAELSNARSEDMAEIAQCLARYGERFQFAPYWTHADLVSAQRARGLCPEDFLVARRRSRIIGCLACWDQRKFKQIVVRRYSSRLRLVRPVWNALAPLAGASALPAPGSTLSIAFLSHLAVENDDVDVFSALLDAGLVRAALRGAVHAILGLAEENPVTAAAMRLKPRNYRSRAYLVCWPEGEEAASRVDARTLHLEVAIL